MTMIEIDPEIDAAHDREWDRLAAPGTWLTGFERVAVARTARGEGAGGDISAAVAEAAVWIHDRPATITERWIKGLEIDGLSRLKYVEILGIVSRLRALDTFTFGLGRSLRPLPKPIAGTPSGAIVDDASYQGGWVPTVGPAGPPNALSAVQAENDALLDLHGHLYLEPRGGDGFTMGNFGVVRDGVNRSQMEFVAARTSLLNDCFF
jgi:hypothetical protein